MPKHNPKLRKPDHGKRANRNQAEEEPYDAYQKDNTKYYMAAIVIAVLAIVVFMVVFVRDTDTVKRVGPYDLVNLDYTVYTYEQYDNGEEPTIRATNQWVNACSRYDSNCRCGYGSNESIEYCAKSLILGFYNKLIGAKEGDIVNNYYIKACIDDDRDGVDDHTGESALSYGFKNDSLYDTDIILSFKIYHISKKQTPSSSALLDLSSLFQTIVVKAKFNWFD